MAHHIKNQSEDLNEALFSHARRAAFRSRDRLGGPLCPENMPVFLNDPSFIRYPTKIVFSREGLEAHQFAQPFFIQSPGETRCLLHVDPRLQGRDDLLVLVVAYMAAVINYGNAATPEVAELQGSILTGMPPEDFYKKICEISDSLSLQPFFLTSYLNAS